MFVDNEKRNIVQNIEDMFVIISNCTTNKSNDNSSDSLSDD